MLLRARVSVLDRPGSLLGLAKAIAGLGGNIVDIEVLASSDDRVVDDLIVDLAGNEPELLMKELGNAGAEVLDLRRTVQVTGQRGDLDLLARVAAEPASAMATVVALAPALWCADWAALGSAAPGSTPRHATPGAPQPLPAGLPEPLGPLPRRGTTQGDNAVAYEVAGMPWGSHTLYLGRTDGPLFLQVELVHLRRVVELAAALAAGVES